jgi:putative acetyltransferase
MLIRGEQPGDIAAIHRVHAAAFPTDGEARLVDALRAAGRLTVSIVALQGDKIVGHVAFSPVEVAGKPGAGTGVGLAPLAVVPEHQRKGIGSRLVREGLAACKRGGAALVVVLGEPAFYQRFGFARASDFGFSNEYGAVDEFMVIVFDTHTVLPTGGIVQYAPEFGSLLSTKPA